MIDENALNIYTDGSSYSSPRAGGIGIRFVFPEYLNKETLTKDFSFTGYRGATNNQMELQACIVALKQAQILKDINIVQRIIVNTDSQYVVNYYKTAILQWSKNKWLKTSGDPVLNAELWKELIKNIRKLRARIEFNWIKGHDKNEHNKAVDKLAKKSAKKANNKLTIVNVRKKISDKIVEYGCVKLSGQKITIRIISSEYLKMQRLHKYKYEIISPNSIFYKNIDIIFHNETLRVGHTYMVSFKKQKNILYQKFFVTLPRKKEISWRIK